MVEWFYPLKLWPLCPAVKPFLHEIYKYTSNIHECRHQQSVKSSRYAPIRMEFCMFVDSMCLELRVWTKGSCKGSECTLSVKCLNGIHTRVDVDAHFLLLPWESTETLLFWENFLKAAADLVSVWPFHLEADPHGTSCTVKHTVKINSMYRCITHNNKASYQFIGVTDDHRLHWYRWDECSCKDTRLHGQVSVRSSAQHQT